VITAREALFAETLVKLHDPVAAARVARYRDPDWASRVLLNRPEIRRYLRHLQSRSVLLSGFAGLEALSQLARESNDERVRLAAASKVCDLAGLAQAQPSAEFAPRSDIVLAVEDDPGPERLPARQSR